MQRLCMHKMPAPCLTRLSPATGGCAVLRKCGKPSSAHTLQGTLSARAPQTFAPQAGPWDLLGPPRAQLGGMQLGDFWPAGCLAGQGQVLAHRAPCTHGHAHHAGVLSDGAQCRHCRLPRPLQAQLPLCKASCRPELPRLPPFKPGPGRCSFLPGPSLFWGEPGKLWPAGCLAGQEQAVSDCAPCICSHHATMLSDRDQSRRWKLLRPDTSCGQSSIPTCRHPLGQGVRLPGSFQSSPGGCPALPGLGLWGLASHRRWSTRRCAGWEQALADSLHALRRATQLDKAGRAAKGPACHPAQADQGAPAPSTGSACCKCRCRLQTVCAAMPLSRGGSVVNSAACAEWQARPPCAPAAPPLVVVPASARQ